MEEDLKAMRDQIRRLERRYLITMVLVIATFVSYWLKYQSAMNDINQMVEITNQALDKTNQTLDKTNQALKNTNQTTKAAIQVDAQTSALCQEVLDNLEILHLELQENSELAETQLHDTKE